MRNFNHRDARNHGLKTIAIRDMNLNAATTYAAVLLKSWSKHAAPKEHTR